MKDNTNNFKKKIFKEIHWKNSKDIIWTMWYNQKKWWFKKLNTNKNLGLIKYFKHKVKQN